MIGWKFVSNALLILYYPHGTPSSGVTAKTSNAFQIFRCALYTELAVYQDTIHILCSYTYWLFYEVNLLYLPLYYTSH